MARLRIMHGFPLSGKSTEADRQRESEGWVVVCPDDFRLALYGQEFSKEAEPLVWYVVEGTVKALLARNHNVLVDATHLTKWSREKWIEVAKEMGVMLDVSAMITSPHVCKERAIADGKPHMVAVIDRMASQFEAVDAEEWKDVEDA